MSWWRWALAAVFAVGPRLDDDDRLALWSALAPLLLILLQGGAYWLLARSWVGRSRMPKGLAALYRGFRIVDVVLLVAGLVGVVLWWPSGPAAALLVVGVWLFGVVEYVNYYVARLAYPVSRWFVSVGQWRTPTLIRDVNEPQAA